MKLSRKRRQGQCGAGMKSLGRIERDFYNKEKKSKTKTRKMNRIYVGNLSYRIRTPVSGLHSSRILVGPQGRSQVIWVTLIRLLEFLGGSAILQFREGLLKTSSISPLNRSFLKPSWNCSKLSVGHHPKNLAMTLRISSLERELGLSFFAQGRPGWITSQDDRCWL